MKLSLYNAPFSTFNDILLNSTVNPHIFYGLIAHFDNIIIVIKEKSFKNTCVQQT